MGLTFFYFCVILIVVFELLCAVGFCGAGLFFLWSLWISMLSKVILIFIGATSYPLPTLILYHPRGIKSSIFLEFSEYFFAKEAPQGISPRGVLYFAKACNIKASACVYVYGLLNRNGRCRALVHTTGYKKSTDCTLLPLMCISLISPRQNLRLSSSDSVS